MDNILIIIAISIYFINTIWKLKKQLHLLQLHSYMNPRYVRWLRQHYAKTFSLKEGFPCLALVPLMFGSFMVSSLLWSASYLVLFLTRTKTQEKKKLVFTPRATRLFSLTIFLLLGLCFVNAYTIISSKNMLITFMSLTVLILFHLFPFVLILLGNLLIAPLEKAINHWYYHDARTRIQQMPRLQVIGITGSFGKTSTKTILQRMLAEKFQVLMTPESYNTPMGITKVIRTSLTPIYEIFIAEMGAKQPGDIQELCDLVAPRFGILTAIGEQHLETFKSLENIKCTKHELIESLPDQGIAFLNMDNGHIRELAPLTTVKKIFYGIDSEGLHYSAKQIRMTSTGSTFEWCTPDGKQHLFQTKLLGKHNIYNILAASAVASELEVEPHILSAVVRSLAPISHRLELKRTSQNITIIDDAFNANPVGAHSALDVLKAIEGERKILISPGMVELGEREYELNKAFGSHAAEVCDYIILVGQQQTVPIQQGLQAANYSQAQYYIAQDLNDANQHLRTVVQPGDVVLYENDLPDTYNE